MPEYHQASSELFDFLLDLIDIQIQKCFRLLDFGAGPNVEIIAMLVKEEIDDLLTWADRLQQQMSTMTLTPTFLNELVSSIKFYVDQEALRSRTALLIADHPVHRAIHDRVQAQYHALQTICDRMDVDSRTMASAETLSQKQRQFRLTSLRVSWDHIEIIETQRTKGLNQIAKEIVHHNSQPKG